MTDQKLKDQEISHRILNYLNAAYQGKFAALNTLLLLGHPSFKTSELEKTESNLKEIYSWLDDLWDGATLFQESRGTRQAEGAVRAFELLSNIQSELEPLAADIESVQETGDLPNQYNNTILLISAFSRSAYGEEHYANGFVRFGTVFNNSDMVKIWKHRANALSEKIKLANEFVRVFKDTDQIPDNFHAHLEFFCRTLPGLFRCHIHDIAQILHLFKGEFGYDKAGFLRPEASAWERAEIAPIDAGYWRALNFEKEEVLQWRKVGIVDPFVAAEWRAAGFDPDQTVDWLRVDFSPLLAIQWATEDYLPAEASILVSKGHHYPHLLTREQAEDLLADIKPPPKKSPEPSRPVFQIPVTAPKKIGPRR
ncbi:MAG: hypothetical protein GX589_06405 [Deltaproteobacteria bacterium]|nr:hypothetical protein [Deltaproteobacteria bacterium]